MKSLIVVVLIFVGFVSYGQELSILERISKLENEVSKSKGVHRLALLDSLSDIISYDTAFRNDSIVKETVAFARALDSFDIAAWHTANLIYHQNNIAGNSKEGKALFDTFLPDVKKVNRLEVLSKFYFEGANSHFNLTEYEKALTYYDSVYNIASRENDLKFMGFSRLGQGQVYTDMGDFGQGSISIQKAITIFREKNDSTRIMDARNSLAILYSKNNFFKEAKAERDEIILLATSMNELDQLPSYYYNAAADDTKTDNQKARLKNLQAAYRYAETSRYKDFYMPIMISGLAVAYAQNDSLTKANEFKDLLEKDREKNTTGAYRGYYLDVLRSMAFAEGNYRDAIVFGEQYLENKQETKQYEELQEASQFLSRAYSEVGENTKALENYERYIYIKDSVESIQKVRVLSYYQTLYETEKRDLTIASQKANIELLEVKDKVKNQWLIFGGLLLLGLFGVVVAIRSRNFAIRKQKLQEGFTQDLLKTQEKERARIAKSLHDNVGQRLLILKNNIALNNEVDTEKTVMITEAIKEVREISHDLHPFQFEKLGLEQSLKNMIETFQNNSTIYYSETIENVANQISKEKELVVFRMLQECLSNVEKHSQAEACVLSSEITSKHLKFQLKDNGKGFNVHAAENGLGMRTLKERAIFIASEFQIISTPEKGTTVRILIPKE